MVYMVYNQFKNIYKFTYIKRAKLQLQDISSMLRWILIVLGNPLERISTFQPKRV